MPSWVTKKFQLPSKWWGCVGWRQKNYVTPPMVTMATEKISAIIEY
jgi:hypothetical protein